VIIQWNFTFPIEGVGGGINTQAKPKAQMQKASKANNYHYKKSLNKFAKANRKAMTKSAACMWKYVLGQKTMLGYQFRRERPVLNYIVDFVCLELLLIVEVDGYTHETEDAVEKDKKRDDELSSVGFTVLRFSSWEVLNRIDSVSEIIVAWIEENAIVQAKGKRKRKD